MATRSSPPVLPRSPRTPRTPRRSTPSRAVRALGALVVCLVALGALPGMVGMVGAAHAADGYRYWGYFHLTGQETWKFSQTGAGDYTPKDGDVEGYRFGTSTQAQPLPPRADLDEVDFESVCAQAPDTGADQKQVAVLLDYGTKADADGASPPEPRGACAVVDQDASGQQVLASVADLRVDKGLTCAVDGYPAKGCGDPVADATVPKNEPAVDFALPAAATPSPSESADAGGSAANDADQAAARTQDSGSGLLWPLVGAGVVVLLLASAAMVLNRRRSSV